MWFRTTWFDLRRTEFRERNFRRYWRRQPAEAVDDQLEARAEQLANAREAVEDLQEAEQALAGVHLPHLYAGTRRDKIRRERGKVEDAIWANEGLQRVLRQIVRERSATSDPSDA